jgi:N-acylglucosamine-6-phosphate 2-epimerase
MLALDALAARWRGGLIASCQPVRGGVFDAPEHVARFALAALDGGAVGLRIEGLADLAAVRAAVDARSAERGGARVPIVGLVKVDAPPTHAFITPTARQAAALAANGADVIAYDATHRIRPGAARDVVAAIHDAGAFAMADLATRAEGESALEDGADFLASTLSGYAPGSPTLEGPDLTLVAALASLGARVIAEGRIATPEQAAAAHERGALAVTIGTAWSRPELIVERFVRALAP